jgi:alpha-1,2-mannosyltransferase
MGYDKVVPAVLRAGPAVVAAALLLYTATYVHWSAVAIKIDLLVYRFGAMRAWDGLNLYATGFTGNAHELLFIYPPFAAMCFWPLTLVSDHSAQALWLLMSFGLVVYVVWRMLTSLGLARSAGLWALTALLVGVVVWLEPVRLSIQLGQINIAILALVVGDLLTARHRKWAGIGVGIAAGIKLTPALFIIYLVAIGRLRAAAVATLTLVATVILGFGVLPSDSTYYWLKGGFDDVGRISHDPVANTSLAGLFLRLHWPSVLGTAIAIGLAAAAVIIAAIAYRRGHPVLGIGIVGMAAAAASPFSWSHHWVWFAPLVVHLGHQAYVRRSTASGWTMWLLCALVGGWFISVAGDTPEAGLLSVRPGGVWNDVIPATYVLVFLTVLVSTAASLWRSTEAGVAGTLPTSPRRESVTV